MKKLDIKTLTSFLALNFLVVGASALAGIEDNFDLYEVDIQFAQRVKNTVISNGKNSFDLISNLGKTDYQLQAKVTVNKAPIRFSFEGELKQGGFRVGFLTGDRKNWLKGGKNYSKPGVVKDFIEIENHSEDAIWIIFANNVSRDFQSKLNIRNFSLKLGTPKAQPAQDDSHTKEPSVAISQEEKKNESTPLVDPKGKESTLTTDITDPKITLSPDKKESSELGDFTLLPKIEEKPTPSLTQPSLKKVDEKKPETLVANVPSAQAKAVPPTPQQKKLVEDEIKKLKGKNKNLKKAIARIPNDIRRKVALYKFSTLEKLITDGEDKLKNEKCLSDFEKFRGTWIEISSNHGRFYKGIEGYFKWLKTAQIGPEEPKKKGFFSSSAERGNTPKTPEEELFEKIYCEYFDEDIKAIQAQKT